MIDALTPEQLAEALGCTADRINELAAAKALPAVRYGRSWRFPVTAVNNFLAEQAMNHVQGKKQHARPTNPGPSNPERLNPSNGRRRPLPDLSAR